MARVESSASLDNNLRDVCNNDFRFPPIQGNLSRHSHGFALVLLRIRELPRARRRYPSREGLIGVFAAHVQKNIAFAGLMNAVHSVRHSCDFADVLCRFGSQGGIASELMHREGKIAKDQPHTWMILFYQLIEKRGEVGTGWAFEIAEFFERNRSLRVAANMNGFRRAPSGHRFICGDGYAT